MSAIKLGWVFAGLLLTTRWGYAQEDSEQLKKRILDSVEKRLKAEEERILKEVTKIIDEELSRSKKGEKRSNVEPKKEKSNPARGFLGVAPEDLTDEEKTDLGVEQGVRIVGLVEGSPAASLLKEGDILLSIDGSPITDTQSVRDVVSSKKAGQKVAVEVLRNEKRVKVTVTLATHPEDGAEQEKGDLREKVKKFLDRDKDEETPKKEKKTEKKKSDEEIPEEGDGLFAFDEEMMDQIRPMLEQFGMNPDDYFEQGEDGKWRPGQGLQELFKQFDFRKFLPQQEGEEDPEPPVERKKEKKEKKVEEKKKEEPKESKKPVWVGLVPAELSDEDRAGLDLEQGVGLAVAEVMKGSPAEKGGIQSGDILTKINGAKVKGEESLQKFIQTAKAGQECQLTVIRKGEEKVLKVILGERKD